MVLANPPVEVDRDEDRFAELCPTVRAAIEGAFARWERNYAAGSQVLIEGLWLVAEIDSEVREALGCSPEDWDSDARSEPEF